ncbi:MAG: OHCU decarboxylase [Elusimicrobia bacterium]|nr:MAG: OHCU decarboxylase [Elusimicrobiota bacterium]
MTLDELNKLSIMEARAAFELCCGARRWIDGMLMRKPYFDAEDLQTAGREIWELLNPEDWKEAFTHHPRIGDIKILRAKWASDEQSGAAGASEETIQSLKKLNDEYFDMFGYIFIVCATGKPADEMLAILKSRLVHDADEEFKIAASEHAKITALRLEKLIKEEK